MAKERVATGIKGLDDLMQGGFPPGKSYLLSGEPGTGKTTFAAQYILEGIKRGENGIYVSVDEKPSHLIDDALSLGWDLKKPLDEGKMALLDVSPYFNWVRGKGGTAKMNPIDANEVIQDLSKQVRRINAKRLVFDSIVPLVLHRDRLYDVQQYIRDLVFGIDDSLGCTTLFTTHIWPGTMGLSEHGVEEFVVSGVILMRLVKKDENSDEYVRKMFVRKMRGTATELREFEFEIKTGEGLVLKKS